MSRTRTTNSSKSLGRRGEEQHLASLGEHVDAGGDVEETRRAVSSGVGLTDSRVDRVD